MQSGKLQLPIAALPEAGVDNEVSLSLNAAWELIRSCILPCVHGQKYQEGGLLLFMRVIGLLFPGMPAHCPQDYVNSTRLGSSDHLQSIKRLA